MTKNFYKWTPAIDDYLCEHYGIDASTDLAEYLGVNINTLRSHCRKLGISDSRVRKFSKEEIVFIEENVDTMTPEDMAGILKRSRNAILSYIKTHGLNVKIDNSKYITLSEANEIVNRDVSSWYGLHIMKTQRGQYVEHEELARYMKMHPEKYDATECDEYFFNIYPFFREKHLQDRKNKCDARWHITA